MDTDSRPTQEEVGPAQGKEGPEQEVPGKENQQIDTGLRRSGRTRKATERYGGAPQPMQRELSPRERKSLAARKVPREKWMILQEGVWKKYRQPTE